MRHAALALLICMVTSGCATTSLPPVAANDYIQENDERRLWIRSDEEQKKLDGSGYLYEDTDLEAYLNDVAKKLQTSNVYSKINFKIKVLKNPFLNAFAFPNGKIYIHTGLLARMENEAQLATLLAHEMTHSTHRHAVRSFRDIKNRTDFLATMGIVTGGFGAIGSMVQVLGQIGTMAAVTGYSRNLETESDTVGIQLMIDAGYDAGESPKLFVYLKEGLKEEDKTEPYFFGSHPRLNDRINNYESLLKTKYSNVPAGIKNKEEFLIITSELLLDNAVLDLKAGRFNVAEKGIEKYLSLKPDEARAYFLLGEVSRQKSEDRDIDMAKENYLKAISMNTTYAEPHKSIGLIYLKNGEKENAKEHLEMYLALRPDAHDKAFIESYIHQCNKGEEK
jgi:predicted Zn-dependent protease